MAYCSILVSFVGPLMIFMYLFSSESMLGSGTTDSFNVQKSTIVNFGYTIYQLVSLFFSKIEFIE